jgi:hypothetical protein
MTSIEINKIVGFSFKILMEILESINWEQLYRLSGKNNSEQLMKIVISDLAQQYNVRIEKNVSRCFYPAKRESRTSFTDNGRYIDTTCKKKRGF